ncbi:MAG: aminodeoxychorismate/anthranilate synthase component II [Mycobacteriaceae bacterium]
MRILVVDNYDSFVFNLVQYLGQLGVDATVLRNDDPALDTIGGFDGVLLSPGPGTPERAGRSMALVHECRQRTTPLLGVCLGHQAIAASFGATVARAPELVHGKTSVITHAGGGVLAGLPEPFIATRYHSLTVLPETIPDALEVTARTAAGVVMGLRHRELPIEGVQFHPESVLTQGGHRLLANWLAVCGRPVDEALVAQLEQSMIDSLGNVADLSPAAG